MSKNIKISLVVPAYNEELVLRKTILNLEAELGALLGQDFFEVIIVDDLSLDGTGEIIKKLAEEFPNIVPRRNHKGKGYGGAVLSGLEAATGESVIIFTADGSDSPKDVFRFYEELEKGYYDFIVGDRFTTPGLVENYPPFKLLFNRVGNFFLSWVFSVDCRDITNSFKLYRLSFLKTLTQFKSQGFELTLEIALKSMMTSHQFKIIDNCWKDREIGVSKMKVLKTSWKYIVTSYLIKTHKI